MDYDVEKIGVVGSVIIDKFNLNISPNTPIFIGMKNRIHMSNAHEDIYNKYSANIKDIIKSPNYVGINPHDGSLEYYKNYGETVVHIKIAVRATGKGIYFARSMYDVNSVSVQNYLNKGRIKEV